MSGGFRLPLRLAFFLRFDKRATEPLRGRSANRQTEAGRDENLHGRQSPCSRVAFFIIPAPQQIIASRRRNASKRVEDEQHHNGNTVQITSPPGQPDSSKASCLRRRAASRPQRAKSAGHRMAKSKSPRILRVGSNKHSALPFLLELSDFARGPLLGFHAHYLFAARRNENLMNERPSMIPIIRNNPSFIQERPGLSDDRLRSRAPSAFAASPVSGVSERYSFVPWSK